MKNSVSTYIDRIRQSRRKNAKLAAGLAVLAAAVAGVVFWQLHSTGVAMTNEVFCGMEEHVHGEDCFEEETPVCGIPEHTHTAACLIDLSADTESADDWEKTLPEELSGVWTEDVAAVAESQIGYTESTANYALSDDGATRMGYTRYGAWYGNAYGDWDAMFVCFCLHYAGVPEETFFSSGARAVGAALDEAGLFWTEGVSKAGDLVFFDVNGDESVDTVAVVSDSNEDEITIVQGNRNDAVEQFTIRPDDPSIAGFGILPAQPEAVLAGQILKAEIKGEDTHRTGAEITLAGMLPEDGSVCAVPVTVELGDIRALAAYDITIYDAYGRAFQPRDDDSIRVSVTSAEIREALADHAGLTVWHMEDQDAEPEPVEIADTGDGSVEFDAECFSIYVVGGEDGGRTYTDPDTGEPADIYTFRLHEYVFDDTAGDEVILTQIVAAADRLSEPAAPEVEHHVFDGWFTNRQILADDHPGYRWDFGLTVAENVRAAASAGNPIEKDGDGYYNLYSDYDPIFYVYFMSEEVPVFGGSGDYVPYVLHTGEYHENDQYLDTAYAAEIYQRVHLNTNYAVTSWYYYENGQKVRVSDRYTVTDDMVLYPEVEPVIWIYFDMGGASAEEVTAVEPAFVLPGVTEIGSGIPEDLKRAGYSFTGWADRNGDPVTADTNPQDLPKNNDGTITLTARWAETNAAYIVNFWRQKQTSSVAAKEASFGDYSREYDLVLTDYVQENEADALLTGSAVSDVMNVPGWEQWTGYDAAAATADDKYFGFEYAESRTESELQNSSEKIAGNGSTVVNIYYDRVTITWNFWNVQHEDAGQPNAAVIYNLTGLWGAELESGEWPSVDIAQNDTGSWIWCHYQSGNKTEYRFDTSYKYLPAGDKTKTECDFYLDPITDGGTLYIYKEVLEPVQDPESGWTHTDTNGDTRYYQLFTSARLNAGVAYGVSEKFDTHTAAHAINSIGIMPDEWQDISTEGGTSRPVLEVDSDTGQTIRLFYDLNSFDVTLYSNGATYSVTTYKYSQPVTPLPGREEMTKAAEEDGSLRPNVYYEFAGWSTADGGTELVEAPATMPSNDLTFYAVWRLKEVTVTYHSGVEDDIGVTGMPEQQTVTVTHAADEPEEPVRDGYVFVGWQTQEGKYFDFSTILYDDVDLTAIWYADATGYTLTYAVDIEGVYYWYTVDTPFLEGSGELILTIEDVLPRLIDSGGNSPDLTDGEIAEIAEKFLCWNSASDRTGTDYYPDSEITFGTENMVIYAKWIIRKTTELILDYNYPGGYDPAADGNPDGTTTVTTGNLDDISLKDASELLKTTILIDGVRYTLMGWSTAPDSPGAQIAADGTVAVDNLNLAEGEQNILYAVWVRELPNTGGPGTGLYTAAGLLLAGSAAFILGCRKRRAAGS